MSSVIFVMLLLLNITGFIAVAMDKNKAKHGMWRIPERFFFTIAALGASPGVYCGCHLFHHKTKHNSFMWGIPAIFLLQLAGVWYIFWR